MAMSTENAIINAIGVLAKAINDGDNAILDLNKQLTKNMIDLTQLVNTLSDRITMLEHELIMRQTMDKS